MTALAGGCLCGAVRYTAQAAQDGIVVCHCSQCRRWSGHLWAGINVTELEITGEPSLRWFRSSDWGERGFCATCGSSLFWRAVESGASEVSAGSLASPTGLRVTLHSEVASKGDYYEIADGVPQRPEGSQG